MNIVWWVNLLNLILIPDGHLDFFVMTCVIEAGQCSRIEKYNRQTNEMMPGGEKLLLNRNVVVLVK